MQDFKCGQTSFKKSFPMAWRWLCLSDLIIFCMVCICLYFCWTNRSAVLEMSWVFLNLHFVATSPVPCWTVTLRCWIITVWPLCHQSQNIVANVSFTECVRLSICITLSHLVFLSWSRIFFSISASVRVSSKGHHWSASPVLRMAISIVGSGFSLLGQMTDMVEKNQNQISAANKGYKRLG